MQPINNNKAKEESDAYYTLIGIALALLIINDLLIIFTGESLFARF